jgi:hypothetical protein
MSCHVLCCAVLCCAVLWCAVLCCAVLCCAVLCRAVVCCGLACSGGVFVSDASALLVGVTCEHNTLSPGVNSGGCLYQDGVGEVTVRRSALRFNSATANGGGLFAFGNFGGKLSLTDSLIEGNQCLGKAPGTGYGGGLYLGGSSVLQNLTLTQNRALFGGAVVAAAQQTGATVSYTNLLTTQNQALSAGGGWYLIAPPTVPAESDGCVIDATNSAPTGARYAGPPYALALLAPTACFNDSAGGAAALACALSIASGFDLGAEVTVEVRDVYGNGMVYDNHTFVLAVVDPASASAQPGVGCELSGVSSLQLTAGVARFQEVGVRGPIGTSCVLQIQTAQGVSRAPLTSPFVVVAMQCNAT